MTRHTSLGERDGRIQQLSGRGWGSPPCACLLPANRWSRCRQRRTCETPIGAFRWEFQPTSRRSRTKIPVWKKKYKKKENVVFNLKGCGNKESKGVEKRKKRGENYTAANSLARWLITVIKNKLLLLLLLLLLGKGIINVVRATAQLVPGTTTRKRKGGWKTTVVWTRLIGNR